METLETAVGIDGFLVFLMKQQKVTQGSMQVPDISGSEHFTYFVTRGGDDLENLKIICQKWMNK